MSKDIQINKFAVQRNGVLYGPGQAAGSIIIDLPDEEADKLIAESNRTIVEIPRHEEIEMKVSAAMKAATSKSSRKASAAKAAPETVGLDTVDPSSTVK